MRTGISITASATDRQRLEAIVCVRNATQKHVWRARIVLMTSDGLLGTTAVMASKGKPKTTVWGWQERFEEEGVDGLLRDKTRPPGIAPLDREIIDKIVELTLAAQRHEAMHWTARVMATAVSVAAFTVQKVWAEGLARTRPGVASLVCGV